MLPDGLPGEQQPVPSDASESEGTVRTEEIRGSRGSSTRARMPKVRLRTFHGEAHDYLEWKREVLATKTLYNVDDDQLGGLVYLACEAGPGKPRDILRHLEIEQVCSADGLKLVWQLLDEECVREPYVRSDEAQTRYEGCHRKPGQTMEEFLRELKLARRMLEKRIPTCA